MTRINLDVEPPNYLLSIDGPEKVSLTGTIEASLVSLGSIESIVSVTTSLIKV